MCQGWSIKKKAWLITAKTFRKSRFCSLDAPGLTQRLLSSQANSRQVVQKATGCAIVPDALLSMFYIC